MKIYILPQRYGHYSEEWVKLSYVHSYSFYVFIPFLNSLANDHETQHRGKYCSWPGWRLGKLSENESDDKKVVFQCFLHTLYLTKEFFNILARDYPMILKPICAEAFSVPFSVFLNIWLDRKKIWRIPT